MPSLEEHFRDARQKLKVELGMLMSCPNAKIHPRKTTFLSSEDVIHMEEHVYPGVSQFITFALAEIPMLMQTIPRDGDRLRWKNRHTVAKRCYTRTHLEIRQNANNKRNALHDVIADDFIFAEDAWYEDAFTKEDVEKIRSLKRRPDVLRQLRRPMPDVLAIENVDAPKLGEVWTFPPNLLGSPLHPPSPCAPIDYPLSIDFCNNPNYSRLLFPTRNMFDLGATDPLLVYDLIAVLVTRVTDSGDVESWAHMKRQDDGEWTLLLTPEQVHTFTDNEMAPEITTCTADTVLSYGSCAVDYDGMNLTGGCVKQLWYRRRCLENFDRDSCKHKKNAARRAEIERAVEAERLRRAAAVRIQACELGRRARARYASAILHRRLRRAKERQVKIARRQLWRLTMINALTKLPHALRIQAAWRGFRARQRVKRLRELKRKHDALEDAEVAAAREKELARRRQAQQSREARQRELPVPLPSHAASTTGNHGKKDGKDRAAVRSVEQAQEHADWTSEAGRQCRTRHGEQTKAEAHAAAVERKAKAKAKARRDKEIEAGKREAERLERLRLEIRVPKSVDEALNEAAAYARAQARARAR